MSASLVGSEMCIRDSSGAAQGGHVPGMGGEQPQSLGRVPPGGCPDRQSCLLYTSDAADDM
eukprot:8237241-Alexandrium_andersonii.AAC.1